MNSKIVLVTGGTRGIGKAICEKFRTNGYLPVTCSRESSEILNHYNCDVSDKNQVKELSEEIKQKYSSISALINNAGGCAKEDYWFRDIPLDEWDKIVSQNFNSVAYVTQSFMPLLDEKSSIINISTTLTNTPMERKSLYSASKAGIETLTRNLALELSKNRIRVNCVSPGPTDTDLLRAHFVNNGVLNKTAYQRFSDSLPYGLVKPEDVANLVYFLCSDEASMITGQIIAVDGGRSLKW